MEPSRDTGRSPYDLSRNRANLEAARLIRATLPPGHDPYTGRTVRRKEDGRPRSAGRRG